MAEPYDLANCPENLEVKLGEEVDEVVKKKRYQDDEG
jgi:hypothetical protein